MTASTLPNPAPAVPAADVPAAARSRGVGRLLRGAPTDPPWARPGLLVLLVATAVLYLWGLGASGWANAFYSAAAQAGGQSWKALFYGSSDPANAITVDKTPAALWIMGLSVRLFGLNSWSILVPQALQGVAAVGLLHATVRRWFGPGAALVSGAVLALTPVAVLMFRFNNPDALLVLLLVAGAYCLVRAVETASTRWLVLAAALVGFGFLAKMLQALLVVPAFAGVYLLAAPTRLRRRLGQLALAALALVVAAGWWVAVVELVPAEDRPFIGGSQGNSILELTLGYNGFGRLTGDEVGGLGNLNFDVGWARLFDNDMGAQISWLLPAALVLGGFGGWVHRRGPRTDRGRAAFLLWGGWLLVTGVVFSYMNGIVHAYYTVALAPAVAALVGMGAAVAWRLREQVGAVVLFVTAAITAVWAFLLLGRTADWLPWLRVVVLVSGLFAALMLLTLGHLASRAGQVVGALGVVAALAAPTAYALVTAATPHTGAIPSAGPSTRGGGGPGRLVIITGPGGGPQGGAGRQPGAVQGGPGQDGGQSRPGRGRGDGTWFPGGGTGEAGPVQGGPGGLLDAVTPSAELVELLRSGAESYTWAAAVVGSNSAAGYQLGANVPVMAVGGFNGTDPAPTLERFQEYVRAGKIHYFIGGAGFSARGTESGGSDAAQRIAEWVAATFTASTVDGTTVYDLTSE
ncbi:glycosyltransferase family 39 protein [Goodfellowiella coeruleoviolacea]|nr:glycosyltransferase family 39 protein [Goodfellowiella coeruleoviolacea]